MDLAVGARRVWIVMEHNTRNGEPRLLRILRSGSNSIQPVEIEIHEDTSIFHDHLLNRAGWRIGTVLPGLGGVDS